MKVRQLCAQGLRLNCVLLQKQPMTSKKTITTFDPVKGRGFELARFPIGEDTGLGADHLRLCDLSPDGSRFAVARSPSGPI
jgi:hypothetical protein